MSKTEAILSNFTSDYTHILVTDTEKAIKDLQQRVEQLENIRKDIAEYVKSKEFAENFPYVMNECQVRSAILKILGQKEVNK